MGGPTPFYQKEAPIDTATVAFLWDYIDWRKVEARVRKLQSRIVKAILNEKKHLVRRLQHLLCSAFFAKLLAVRRVTSNTGKRTPGIDHVRWSTSRSKGKAALSLDPWHYKARALKRVYIEKKGKKKKRPLGIPTMYDRAIQALFALALDPVAETLADHHSFGFRKFRSLHDACQFVFNTLSRKAGATWILEGDIRGCFDNINHTWLMNNIPLPKRILRQFLKSGYKYKNRLFPTESGTPQGGIISPVLANMTLDRIETMLKQKYWRSPTGLILGPCNKKKVNFVRYADDFIVTATDKETILEIKQMIRDFLVERGLTLSEEKTLVTHISTGFDFLGWNFRKYNGTLIVKPSWKSIKSITDKIKLVIKQCRGKSQDELISRLNPVIRGWCNNHKRVASKETFQKLDSIIYHSLWRWAVRSHNRKNRKWIKDRYWKTDETRFWIFRSETKLLYYAAYTKIRRHKLVRLNANPYIEEDRQYLENRRKTRRA